MHHSYQDLTPLPQRYKGNMATISRDQAQIIIQNAPQGTDPRAILDELVKRGHTIEGVDMQMAQERVAGKMTPQEVEKTVSIRDRVANVTNMVFGGRKIGEALGTQLVKGVQPQEARGIPRVGFESENALSDEERARAEQIFRRRTGRDIDFSRETELQDVRESVTGPSGKEVAGDVARVGSTFFPIGKIAGLGTRALQTVGLRRGAQTVGNVIAGGAGGAAIDLSEGIASDRDLGLGFGTLFGAGIPAAAPVAAAIGRTTARLTGKFGSEISGALTGTSAETVEQAFRAAKEGGEELDNFTAALRGKTTPEKLAQQLRDNTQVINTQRQTLFRETLAELGEETVNTNVAKVVFADQLADAGITVNNNVLDFSGSKLKLVPSAQSKIQTAYDEIVALDDIVTLEQIDTTRQALKALQLTGDEPAANLANKLHDDAVRGTRKAGEQVDGYGQMLDEFAETSEFLDELQRGLSSGDQKTIDQTYRRMATALKTNNEQRMALIRELDEVTDGSILSSISGQQLSETMPRGIFRQIAAGIAGGAVLTGGLSQGMIPALVFASPRVTGEVVKALGLTARQTTLLVNAIVDARNVLIKIGAISGAVIDPSDQE